MKKIIAIILALVLVFGFIVTAWAQTGAIPDQTELQARFISGEGPETNGYKLDYKAYSPVGADDRVKYPVVIWLHGMGEGSYPGEQIEKNGIAFWASDEFQARFTPAGGAFIIAVRSLEEKNLFWTNDLIVPLKATIDAFIAQNAANVDLTRIYIGGFSMGGKMTLRMAISYPEFFAAAFPICPAFAPTAEQLETIKDMPVWITASRYDILAGYHTYTASIWNDLVKVTNVPENCRLTKMGRATFPDGKKTVSNHHAWFAVTYDMFCYDGSSYKNMETYGATGAPVTLTYPDGMISWLSGFTSDYNGAELTPTGKIPLTEGPLYLFSLVVPMLKASVKIIADLFSKQC